MNLVNKKKQLIMILISLLVSIALALLFPSNVGKQSVIADLSLSEADAIVSQKIEAVSMKPTTVTKIFYKGNLLGVLYNSNLVDEAIETLEEKYDNVLVGNSTLELDDNIYTLTENSFWVYENKDEEIINYLIDNNLIVTEATQIQIVDTDGNVKDTIYVNNIDDFTAALKRFALCFIDEDTYNKLENNEEIPNLTSYGTQNKNIYLEETLKSSSVGAAVEDIFYDEDTIFNYLCYGKDYTLNYYTVEEYDTVAGAADKNGLTAEQLVALNPDLESVNQMLVAGQQLIVSNFNSPITIVVEQERISKLVTYPESASYEMTDSLSAGVIKQITEEKNGYNDVTYTDIYVNGEYTSYREEKVVVVEQPVQAVYQVGKGSAYYDTGGLSFILPVENPWISCPYMCYTNHRGVDFYNRLHPSSGCLIYACEDGVVLSKGYDSSMGNYYIIDSGNGYVLYYMHMMVTGFIDVGTTVTRGQAIGYLGSTGKSTGPHVHIGIEVDGTFVDPCSTGLLPCSDALNASSYGY